MLALIALTLMMRHHEARGGATCHRGRHSDDAGGGGAVIATTAPVMMNTSHRRYVYPPKYNQSSCITSIFTTLNSPPEVKLPRLASRKFPDTSSWGGLSEYNSVCIPAPLRIH